MQPTLINLHPKEYSQELHYYPFVVKLDRCVDEVIIILMTYLIKHFNFKDFNLGAYNMITEINE